MTISSSSGELGLINRTTSNAGKSCGLLLCSLSRRPNYSEDINNDVSVLYAKAPSARETLLGQCLFLAKALMCSRQLKELDLRNAQQVQECNSIISEQADSTNWLSHSIISEHIGEHLGGGRYLQ
jgi:hypothetical protein